ncbi:MAG: tetratricopeptide repeat protein [Anaerolineae bacterium]|nr:tetratricopeptide repeat protein [Anaerolineae bacterium]
MITSVQEKITAYVQALESLDNRPTSEALLACLLTRDALEAELHRLEAQDIQAASLDICLIATSDERLRTRNYQAADHAAFSAWRAIVNPDEQAWWWYPEQPAAKPGSVWSVFVIALEGLVFTLALSTGLDITQRFLAAGGDFAAYVLTLLQAFLAAITAGSFTRSGREFLNRIWMRLRLSRYLYHNATLVLTLALLSFVISLRLLLPTFAAGYNARAVAQMQSGQLALAVPNLQRAVSLNPDFAQAHYNLGSLYEELLEYDAALSAYRTAIRANAQLDVAYNNLGRLLIVHSRDYALAALTLRQGLTHAEDAAVRYALHKNLGWAYMANAQYDLALEPLNYALNLYPDRGAPHCLLAQAYEGLEEYSAASAAWEQCLAYANVYDPYENTWATLARQRVAASQGGNP